MKNFLKFTSSKKRNNFIVLTLALVMGLLGLATTWSPSAEAQITPPPCVTLTNPTPIVIPSGAPATTSGPASPYPSTINVAGLGGTVTKVTVTLNGLSHTFPDDVDILLVGPGGQSVILMSDAGGALDVTNVNLTFDDTGAMLPDSTQIVSGTYQPTNFVAGDTFPAPAPVGPYGATLAAFNGSAPNGTYSLYVLDDLGGDVGSISGGWTLRITTTSCGGAATPTPTPVSSPTPVASPTPGATPTPTPGGNVCTPTTIVTEGDLFPGGIPSFGVSSGPGSVTVDHVNTGTGLQSLTVVPGSVVNAVVTIPPFVPGTINPVVVTFTTPNPGQAVSFRLRAASQFHAIFIDVRCAATCTPTTVVSEGDLFPGGIPSFGVSSGPGSVTVDHVNTGTGLQSLTVVPGSVVNAVVTIPPFVPGTINPVVVTFTVPNPALPTSFRLRAASTFHAAFIDVRCGTITPTPTPTPVASPTPTPVASPTPTPVASPTPTPVASPTPTPMNACTFSNGGLNPQPTSKSGVAAPAGSFFSEVQNNTGNTTESNTVSGFTSSPPFRLADNFTIGQRCTLASVVFFAYQTGSPATPSPFTAYTLQIWNGRPGDPGAMVIFGDTTTNRLASSTDTMIFRIFNTVAPPPGTATTTTRRIWANSVTIGTTLNAGTYWFDWAATSSGTNFTPSVTIQGSRGAAGANARQLSAGVWIDVIDTGNPPTAPDVPQDFPFNVMGTATP